MTTPERPEDIDAEFNRVVRERDEARAEAHRLREWYADERAQAVAVEALAERDEAREALAVHDGHTEGLVADLRKTERERDEARAEVAKCYDLGDRMAALRDGTITKYEDALRRIRTNATRWEQVVDIVDAALAETSAEGKARPRATCVICGVVLDFGREHHYRTAHQAAEVNR